MMKYFFWIAFAVFLAASIPHVAYFFASFEPSNGPEGIWWWAVSYAIAISIDVTVYLLSWTAFQRYRKYRTAKAVWQHWLLIIMCTVFSWIVNWAYARQFHSPTMLNAAEAVAPWLSNVFPFMASAFPLLGIVYTMMAETISETAAEEKKEEMKQLTTLAELAKQTRLPLATLRRALVSGSHINAASLLAIKTNTAENGAASETADANTTETGKVDTGANRAITGQFVTLEETGPQSPVKESKNTNSSDTSQDKLQMTIEVLKANATISDEALAEHLSLKRPASARFWRLKATEILNSQERELVANAATPDRPTWASNGSTPNGAAPNGATPKK
ncbi:MAG: hypothetical protein IMW89_12605 [Ktedonobacteraceae bacterium]|nr:hypothetical protein [Ktedonobacteraceae bacterium]